MNFLGGPGASMVIWIVKNSTMNSCLKDSYLHIKSPTIWLIKISNGTECCIINPSYNINQCAVSKTYIILTLTSFCPLALSHPVPDSEVILLKYTKHLYHLLDIIFIQFYQNKIYILIILEDLFFGHHYCIDYSVFWTMPGSREENFIHIYQFTLCTPNITPLGVWGLWNLQFLVSFQMLQTKSCKVWPS